MPFFIPLHVWPKLHLPLPSSFFFHTHNIHSISLSPFLIQIPQSFHPRWLNRVGYSEICGVCPICSFRLTLFLVFRRKIHLFRRPSTARVRPTTYGGRSPAFWAAAGGGSVSLSYS